MIDLIPPQLRVIALAIVAALLFGSGWAANGWRLGEQVALTEKSHSDTMGEIARASARQLSDQLDARLLLERQLSDIDSTKHKELTDAQAENERLRRLYSGAVAERKRLRIEARIAAADLVVSSTSGAGSLGDGASVELSDRAGSTVWNIRSAMISDQKKLEYLQDYVRRITAAPSVEP